MSKEERRSVCLCVGDGGPEPNCYWCNGTGWETRNTDEPVCPYCGELMSTDDIYESGTYQCENCEKWVEWEIEYTPSYTTAKGEDPYERRKREREEYEKWLALQKKSEADTQ